MIPKIIHYCWFGRNPKPKLAVKCMRSWKKHCSSYKVIEWNEDTFDIAGAPRYVQEAYENKKWAFVTDYVRLYALYNYGGIYMDTDVEVLKRLDDYLPLKGFGGFENEDYVSTAIMAAVKGHPLIHEWMNEYEQKSFILPDGTMNLETNVVAITNSMKRHDLRLDNTMQIVEGFTIYPKDYFCPKSYIDGRIYKTRNTVTIHHFAGSWLSEAEKKRDAERIAFERNERITRPIKELAKSVIGEGLYGKIKERLKR